MYNLFLSVISDQPDIKRIKDQGIYSNDPQTIMRAIDALEPYGKKVIEDIEDILTANYHDEVKRHGLEVIARLTKPKSSI